MVLKFIDIIHYHQTNLHQMIVLLTSLCGKFIVVLFIMLFSIVKMFECL